MGAAEYDTLMALKVRALTPDGMGGATRAESTVAGYEAVPCFVQTLPTREVVRNDKIVHIVLKNVIVDIAVGVVTTDHFLTISGVDYEILDVIDTAPLKIQIEKKV